MMNDEEEDLLLTVAAAVTIDSTVVKRKKKRFWVRRNLRRRNSYSGSDLIKDLTLDDVNNLSLECRCSGGFRNFFRTTTIDFETLLHIIGSKISEKDTTFRPAIPVCDTLTVTLRYFATGDSYLSFMYTFKISKQVISTIVVTRSL